MKQIVLWGFGAALVLLAGCVSPEQHQMLENRISALEIESNRQMARQTGAGTDLATTVGSLEQKMQTDDQMYRESMANLRQELRQLQENVGRLEGRIEEMMHQSGAMGTGMQPDPGNRLDRMDQAISRNHMRITTLESHMGFEPAGPGPDDTVPGAPAAGAGPAAPLSEKGAYDAAKRLFDDGDMQGAREQFENFIATYPGSVYAGNARYWIADSHYVDKWFEKAILEYQKVIEQYPDSNKTAAARLKQGYAFAELGENANARLILNELITRYPDSREAGFAAEKLKQLN
ncbi:MAG: tol-pal system protein YbgF [Desulfotignum sp.]